MVDNLTKKQRSFCMSRIRSKWTSPEKKIHNFLKGPKVVHKMYPRIEGNPDIVIKNKKIAIFFHGCFWHQHPKCKYAVRPKSNKKFWLPKLKKNVQRDKKNINFLRKRGYSIIILWECEVRKEKNWENTKRNLLKKLL